MKTLSAILLLVRLFEVGNPCMSTENPWDTTTTTTTATPRPACTSCDLAALYSNTFCPLDDGCENFYPLEQAAKVVNGTPPCIEVQNICPPGAFIGLDRPGSETSLPSSDYADNVHIECDSMGQWQATVQEANTDGTSNAVVSPIQKLSCYPRKDCATCWDAVVTTDHQICLDLMQPKECIDSSNITSGFARDVRCNSLIIVCQGNTVIQLDTGYTVELPMMITDPTISIGCTNHKYLFTSDKGTGFITKAACAQGP